MKELKFILLAQIIGCFLVIWGHSYPFVTEMPQSVQDVKGFLYMFHMPLFVFCSGFLFSYTEQTSRKSIGAFIKQRAIKLLVPYVVLSLIGILPKYVFSSVLNDSLQLDWLSLIRFFLVPRENIWGHFWFLPMIFLMGYFAFLMDKSISKGNKRVMWGTISFILFVLAIIIYPSERLKWFGINDLAKFGWSYAMGVEAYYLFGDLKEKIKIQHLKLLLISMIGGSISLIVGLLTGLQNTWSPIVATIMIISILFLCLSIENRIKVNRQSLISQTYQIFILSWPCQLVVEIILERILHLQWWILIPSVFLTGVVGPLILIKMIDCFETKTNTHFLSLIIGK